MTARAHVAGRVREVAARRVTTTSPLRIHKTEK